MGLRVKAPGNCTTLILQRLRFDIADSSPRNRARFCELVFVNLMSKATVLGQDAVGTFHPFEPSQIEAAQKALTFSPYCCSEGIGYLVF